MPTAATFRGYIAQLVVSEDGLILNTKAIQDRDRAEVATDEPSRIPTVGLIHQALRASAESSGVPSSSPCPLKALLAFEPLRLLPGCASYLHVDVRHQLRTPIRSRSVPPIPGLLKRRLRRSAQCHWRSTSFPSPRPNSSKEYEAAVSGQDNTPYT